MHNPRCAVHTTVALIYGLLYPQRKAHSSGLCVHRPVSTGAPTYTEAHPQTPRGPENSGQGHHNQALPRQAGTPHTSLLEPQGTWREGRARSYKAHVLSPGVSRAEKALLHTHVPTIPIPPHIQQEPLQLPTISTNYHTCWERDLINYPLGLEGEPGPRAGVPGLSPLPQVAFQVWGKGLQ